MAGRDGSRGSQRPPLGWWRDDAGDWQPPENHPRYAALQEEIDAAPPPKVHTQRFTLRSIVEIVLGLIVTVGFGWVTWFLFQPHPGSLFVATASGKLMLGILPTCLGVGIIVHGLMSD